MNLFRTYGRTPWTADQPDTRPIPPQDNTTQKNGRHIQASSGIRTHAPSVRAAEDNTCLRPRGHWDRHKDILVEWSHSSTYSVTLAIDGGEWSTSRPGRFTPRKIATGAHWIGGWMGSRTGLDTVSKRKFPAPARNRTPIVQPIPVAIPAELSQLFRNSVCNFPHCTAKSRSDPSHVLRKLHND
jgi:hypothetical protein